MKRRAVSKIRGMYINARGELFLQFTPEYAHELETIPVGYTVFEPLQSGYQVEGEVSRVTSSGISLIYWRLV